MPDANCRWQKAYFRKVYNEVNKQANAGPCGVHDFFLNLGYIPTGASKPSMVSIPDEYGNIPAVRLVVEVIGENDLTGLSVLDVGSGRGGTAWMLRQFFRPTTVTGIDLSLDAVQFCARTHKYENV